MKKVIWLSALLWLTCVLVAAQTSPYWPSSEKPSLKLNFGKFVRKRIVDNHGIYTSDLTVQNVSDQGMPRSIFTVFVTDANGVRIGRGRLQLPEIPP